MPTIERFQAAVPGTVVGASKLITPGGDIGPTGPPGPSGATTGDMLKSVYDTNNDGIVDHAALADTAPWTGITGKPASFTPSAHEATHLDNGSDAIPLATTARTGLSPQIPSSNPTKQFHRGDNTYAAANYPDLTNIPTSFAPSAHAPSHVTGGADIIPVVTSSATGLVPMLPTDTTKFLRGDGTFARTAVSTDAGNLATLGSDSLISVPQSSIWSMRMRSFNAIGNPTFEVDQRNVGNALTYPAASTSQLAIDRWNSAKVGTMTYTLQQVPASALGAGPPLVPATNFRLSANALVIKLATQETSLAAGDYIQGITQQVEGPLLRELIGDVHSVSLLVLCTQAPVTFSVRLSTTASPWYSLTKTCTISTANQWTYFTLPNLPVFTPSGTWALTPGTAGYYFSLGFGAGTTYTSPANDTWQSGLFLSGPGTTNFASLPVNTQFVVGFIQHEPGAVCSTPMDCPFTQNYDDCLRYYQKNFDYGTAPGTATAAGLIALMQQSTTNAFGPVRFHKPMAKTPTMTGYNHNSGAVNYCRQGATDYPISAFLGAGTTGFYGITTSSAMPAVVAGSTVFLNYTADTGW